MQLCKPDPIFLFFYLFAIYYASLTLFRFLSVSQAIDEVQKPCFKNVGSCYALVIYTASGSVTFHLSGDIF